MYDLWVENIKTGESYRVTRDSTKPVYIGEDGQTVFKLEDIAKFKFYPCCPREAPKNDVPEAEYEQTSIFDFL